MGILWAEAAVLVEHRGACDDATGERRIIDRGSLIDICQRLRKRDSLDLKRLTVSLSDGRGPPTTYTDAALSMLLIEVAFEHQPPDAASVSR